MLKQYIDMHSIPSLASSSCQPFPFKPVLIALLAFYQSQTLCTTTFGDYILWTTAYTMFSPLTICPSAKLFHVLHLLPDKYRLAPLSLALHLTLPLGRMLNPSPPAPGSHDVLAKEK